MAERIVTQFPDLFGELEPRTIRYVRAPQASRYVADWSQAEPTLIMPKKRGKEMLV